MSPSFVNHVMHVHDMGREKQVPESLIFNATDNVYPGLVVTDTRWLITNVAHVHVPWWSFTTCYLPCYAGSANQSIWSVRDQAIPLVSFPASPFPAISALVYAWPESGSRISSPAALECASAAAKSRVSVPSLMRFETELISADQTVLFDANDHARGIAGMRTEVTTARVTERDVKLIPALSANFPYAVLLGHMKARWAAILVSSQANSRAALKALWLSFHSRSIAYLMADSQAQAAVPMGAA